MTVVVLIASHVICESPETSTVYWMNCQRYVKQTLFIVKYVRALFMLFRHYELK